MSMTFAFGEMPNITPRQTAGAAGPKSVRNVMTGRIGGWYQGPHASKRRREEVRRRFDFRPLGPMRTGRATGMYSGSMRSGAASVG
jgi:hypothetical protein